MGFDPDLGAEVSTGDELVRKGPRFTRRLAESTFWMGVKGKEDATPDATPKKNGLGLLT